MVPPIPDYDYFTVSPPGGHEPDAACLSGPRGFESASGTRLLSIGSGCLVAKRSNPSIDGKTWSVDDLVDGN
jgi:hypothetical protein